MKRNSPSLHARLARGLQSPSDIAAPPDVWRSPGSPPPRAAHAGTGNTPDHQVSLGHVGDDVVSSAVVHEARPGHIALHTRMLTLSPDEDAPEGSSQPILDSLHHIDDDLSDGFLPGSSDSSPWGLARQPAAASAVHGAAPPPGGSGDADGVASSLSDDEDLPLAALAKRTTSPAALSRAQISVRAARSHPSVPNFSQNTTSAAKSLSAKLAHAAPQPVAYAEHVRCPDSAGTPGPQPPRAPSAALVTPAAQRTRSTRSTHSGSAQRKSRQSRKRAPRALQALQAFNVSPSRGAREAAAAATAATATATAATAAPTTAVNRVLDLKQPATPAAKPTLVPPARAVQVPSVMNDATCSLQRALSLAAACQDCTNWPADLTHLALGYDSVVPNGHAADVAGEVLAVCALQARVTEHLPSLALPCFDAMQALLGASMEGQRVAVYFGAAQEWYPATVLGVQCSSTATPESPSPAGLRALATASAATGLSMLQLGALAALAQAPGAPLPPVPRAGRRLLGALGPDIQQHSSAMEAAGSALATALRRLLDGQAAALTTALLPERIAFDMEFGDGTRSLHALGHSPMLWGPPNSAALSEAAREALATLATIEVSAADLGTLEPASNAAAAHSDASSCSNLWSEADDSAEEVDLEELAASPLPRKAAAEPSSQSSAASHTTPQLARRGGLKHSAAALPGSSVRRVHFSAQAKPPAPEPAAEDGVLASENPFETPPRTKAAGRGAAARARIADVNLSPDELAHPSLPGAQYAVLRIGDAEVTGRVVPQADGSTALASEADQLPASACSLMASTPAGARAAGPLPPGTAAWLVAHGAELQGIPAYAGILAGTSCLPAAGKPAAKPAPIPAAQVVCPAVAAIPAWLTQRDHVVILGQTDAVVYCALLGSLDMSQLAGAPLTVVAEIVSSAASCDGHASTVALCAPAHVAPGLAQWCEAELGRAGRAARGAAALASTPCASRAFLDELKLTKAMWQARTGMPAPAPELNAKHSPNKTSSPGGANSKASGASGKSQQSQAEAHLSPTSLLNALTVTTHRRRSAGAAVVVSDIALHDFVQAAGALPTWGGPATSRAAASTAARAGAKRRRGRGGADPMLNAAAVAMAVDPCLRTAKVLWSWAQGSPAVHPAWCVLANHSDAGVRLALSSAAAMRAMGLPALLPPGLQQLAGPADAAAQPHAPLYLPHAQRALAGFRLSSMLQAYDGVADRRAGGALRASPASQGTGWLQRVADTPCPAQVAQAPSSLLEWAWNELLDGGKLIEAAVEASPVLTGASDEDCERVVQAASGKYVDVVGLLWLWVLREAVARGAARHITVAGLASLLGQLGAPVPAQLASRSTEPCSLDQVCAALDVLSSACPCACLVKPLPMANGALQSSSYKAAGILHALVLAAADALCVPCVGFEWLVHVLGAHAVRAAKQPALTDWHQDAQEQYAEAVMQFAVPTSWCTHAILSHVVPGFQAMPRLALLRARHVDDCTVHAAGSLLQPAGSLRCCCEALPGSAHVHISGCMLSRSSHAATRFASGWPVLLGAAATPEQLHTAAAPRVLLAGTLEDVVVAVHAQHGPRMYMARVRGALPAELAGNTGLAQAHQDSLLVPVHAMLAMPSGAQ